MAARTATLLLILAVALMLCPGIAAAQDAPGAPSAFYINPELTLVPAEYRLQPLRCLQHQARRIAGGVGWWLEHLRAPRQQPGRVAGREVVDRVGGSQPIVARRRL